MFSVSDQSPVFLKNEVCLSTVRSSLPCAEGTAERSTGQLQSSAGSVRVEPVLHRHSSRVGLWVDGMDRSPPGPLCPWVAISSSIVEPGAPAKLSRRPLAFFFSRTSQGIERERG